MSIIDSSKIPLGWEKSKLGDIIELKYGKGLRKDKRDPNGTIPVYGSNGIVGYHSEALTNDSSIIIGRKGSVGEVHLAESISWPIDTTYYIYSPKGIDLLFLYHLMSFLNLGSLDKSTAIPGINRNDAYAISVIIPPFNEQERIVNKIEELFTKLDAGIQELISAKEKLKIYRQSVLKHAFEGKLTEEWRKIHKDNLISSLVVLEKIKKERKNVLGKKYKEPTTIETSELPELPEKWVWTNVESLAQVIPHAIKAGPFGSALKKAFYVPQGYKIYGQEQVIRNDPYYGNYFIDKDRFETLKSCQVKPGDVLISLVGTIGKVLILPDDIEHGIINPRLVKFSLDERIVNSKFIKIYLESTAVRHFFSIASHGGTMDILNLTILKKLPISLPPLEEQNRLVDEIEQKFIIINEIEKEINQNMIRAQKLRQSILKKAFRGQLVPQDPNDEPAEKLLERIKAGKEKQKPKKTKSKQKALV